MSQKTILILVDIAHQESAVELCHYAAALLPDSGGLHLAYVLPYGNFSYVEPYVSADSLKASAKRAHDELGAIRHAVGIEANAHVLRGSIGEQALLLAKTISADLIARPCASNIALDETNIGVARRSRIVNKPEERCVPHEGVRASGSITRP